MPSRTVTIRINTESDLAGLQDIINGLNQLEQTTKQFGGVGATTDFNNFAKAVRSMATSAKNMNKELPGATTNLQAFVGVIKQLDSAIQGVPMELKDLAAAVRQTGRAVKTLDDSNKTIKRAGDVSRETTKHFDAFGRKTREIQNTVKTNVWEDLNGELQKVDVNVEETGKSFDKSGKLLQRWAGAAREIWQSSGKVTTSVDRMGNEITEVRSRLEPLIRLVQQLHGVFTRFGKGLTSISFKGMNQFATTASAMFARLRSNLAASGGLFVSFHRRVEDSMARSKRATLDFLNSGWSFLTSGYTIRQFGLNALGGVQGMFQGYTEYERNLTRTAVAASETGTPNPALIQDMIFRMQRGEYGAPVKQFSADDIANAAYFYASAIGKNFTQDNIGTLAPVITELLQIANVTRTDPETVTKGVINVMTEFGMDPREDQNAGRMRGIAAEMAYLSNISTLEFPDIAESFKMMGPMAGQLGATPEDALALLYFMSEVGLRGGQAGRGISQTFSRILDPTEKMLGLSQQYGLTQSGSREEWRALFLNNDGTLRGGVPGMLETIMSAGEPEEMATIIAELFSENATRTLVGNISQLLKGKAADKDVWNDIMSKITGDLPQDWLAGAITANNESLAAAFKWLESAWFQVTTTMVDAVKGPLIDALDTVTQLLFKFTDILKNNPAISKFAMGVITIVGSLASFIGTAFIALGSLLLMAKAFNLTQGAGFKMIGVVLGLGTAFMRLIPIFLLMSVISGVIAAAWRNDFGGIATYLSNLDFADVLSDFVVNVTKGLAVVAQAWFEFINLLISSEGPTQNLRKVLDAVFGDYLGTYVFAQILRLRDAVARLKDDIADFAQSTGIRDLGDVLRNAFGAGRAVLSFAVMGKVPEDDLRAAYKFFHALGVDNPTATFRSVAEALRHAMRWTEAFAKVLWQELQPSIQQIIGLFQALWNKLVDGQAAMNFLRGAVTGFVGVMVALVKINGEVAEALTGVVDRIGGLSTALGTAAGIITGVMVARALLPFDKAVVMITAHLADFILRTVVLGGLQAIFTGLAFAMQLMVTSPLLGLGLLVAGILLVTHATEDFSAGWMQTFKNIAEIAIDVGKGIAMGLMVAITVLQALAEYLSPVIDLLMRLTGQSDALQFVVAGIVAYALVGAPLIQMLTVILGLFGANTIAAQVFGLTAVRAFGGIALGIFALAPAFTWLFEKLGMSKEKAEALGMIAGGVAGGAIANPRGAGRLAKGGKYALWTAAGLVGQMGAGGVAALGAPLVIGGASYYLLSQADNKAMTPEDFQARYQQEVEFPISEIAAGNQLFPYQFGSTPDYLDDLLKQRNPNYVPNEADRQWAMQNELAQQRFNLDKAFYENYGILPSGQRFLDVPQDTATAIDPGYYDLTTGKVVSQTQAEAIMTDDARGKSGLAGAWTPSEKYQLSAADQAALSTDKAKSDTEKLINSLGETVNGWFGGRFSNVDTSSIPAFVQSVFGNDLGLDTILKGFGIDLSDLTVQPSQFLNGQDLLNAQKAEAASIAVKQKYFEKTGRDLTEDQRIAEIAANAGSYSQFSTQVSPSQLTGAYDAGAHQDAMNEVEQEAQALADAEAHVKQVMDRWASSIESISLGDMLKALFDPYTKGQHGSNVGSVLYGQAGTILDNLKTTLGVDTLPWQNEFELMMDAAGTGGFLGTDTGGKNLHKLLRPFLETFAAQSGVNVDDLMKGIPIFAAPEEYVGMAQADLIQRAQALGPNVYKRLDLLGSGQFGTQVFDPEGLDWSEIANFAAGRQDLDWNLTDVLMELWDMTKEEAEQYIRDNQLDPSVISGKDFKDTKLYKDALGGQVNVLTDEWMNYLNLVTNNGTDKTIEMTQEQFDKLPDIIKIGFSNMGYTFVIGGKAAAHQIAATNEMLLGQVEQTYEVFTKGGKKDTGKSVDGFWDRLWADLGDDGVANSRFTELETFYDEYGNAYRTFVDNVTGQTVTIPGPEVETAIKQAEEYAAYIDEMERLTHRLELVRARIEGLKESKRTRKEQTEMGGPMASGVGFGLYMGIDEELEHERKERGKLLDMLGVSVGESGEYEFNWDGMFPTEDEINAELGKVTEQIVTTFTTNLTNAIPQIQTATSEMIKAASDVIMQSAPQFAGATMAIVQAVAGGLRNGAPIVSAAGFALGEAASLGVLNGLRAHLTEIQNVVNQIRTAANVGNNTPPPSGGGGAPVVNLPDLPFVGNSTGGSTGATSTNFAARNESSSFVTTAQQPRASGGNTYALNIGTVNASSETDVNNLISRVNKELGDRYELERRGVNATRQQF